MKKRVSGFALLCIAIGMFLMLFIPKGVVTILSIVVLVYFGYKCLCD